MGVLVKTILFPCFFKENVKETFDNICTFERKNQNSPTLSRKIEENVRSDSVNLRQK